MTDQPHHTLHDLVFVGFNSRVAALDRYTGETVWSWKSPQGSGYVALLVDGDRLIVSVNGYMYCLDPIFGQEVWSNSLPGFGTGVPCLASVNAPAPGTTGQSALAAEAARRAAAAAATAAAAG